MSQSTPGLIFDDRGKCWLAHSASLGRQLGVYPGSDVVGHAVRDLGFVYVGPLRGALLVKFEPSTVCLRAAFEAFYEISRVAPNRLVLGRPAGAAGLPDRYEIVCDWKVALTRVEAAAMMVDREKPHRPESNRPGGEPAKLGRMVSFRDRDGRAVRKLADNVSIRVSQPLQAISVPDEWMRGFLIAWRGARRGFLLPTYESLASLDHSDHTRDRAHIVDTMVTDAMDFSFRLWGAVNSYGNGYSKKRLGQMPGGLMRDNAIEDYWDAVMTGVPSYHLIRLIENGVEYSYARLILPLANARRVDQLFVLINERNLEIEIPSASLRRWTGERATKPSPRPASSGTNG
jgi:hypothetical protein